ncbi:hypothetical protein LEMLEM_LOCUS6281 [Lemmus lemmus]
MYPKELQQTLKDWKPWSSTRSWHHQCLEESPVSHALCSEGSCPPKCAW